MTRASAWRLARASIREMLVAARLGAAPRVVRASAALALAWPSLRLARALASFDHEIEGVGVSRAARRALGRLGVPVDVASSAAVPRGPLLVVANHPGAYDALAVLAALGRDDASLVAADRPFLRELPALASRLVFVPDPADDEAVRWARGVGARLALRHVARGGALVLFAAGRIEPDPAVDRTDPLVASWSPAAGAFALATWRRGGQVVVATVAGVHAARAKRSPLVRAAERRGVTTLAPLVQLTCPALHAVRPTVTLDGVAPVDGESAAIVTVRLRETCLAAARRAAVRAR